MSLVISKVLHIGSNDIIARVMFNDGTKAALCHTRKDRRKFVTFANNEPAAVELAKIELIRKHFNVYC